MSPRRKFECRWQEYMSDDLALRLRQVTCIVHGCQLRLCGQVARLPLEDPVHRILSGTEGPPASCMIVSGGVLAKDMGIARPASAWAIARRRPKEYRRKVDAATRHQLSEV